jgi:hypothetical protein
MPREFNAWFLADLDLAVEPMRPGRTIAQRSEPRRCGRRASTRRSSPSASRHFFALAGASLSPHPVLTSFGETMAPQRLVTLMSDPAELPADSSCDRRLAIAEWMAPARAEVLDRHAYPRLTAELAATFDSVLDVEGRSIAALGESPGHASA